MHALTYHEGVTREEVWENVAKYLGHEFGKLLSVRDVRRLRRAGGEGWSVTVAMTAPSGDLHVADLVVEASGAISPKLTGDHIVRAVHNHKSMEDRNEEGPNSAVAGDLGDLAELTEGEGDSLGMLDQLGEADPVEDRVSRAIASGTKDGLEQARELLPRLLGDHERRGTTLFRMAQVELKLDERGLAKGYLEAAAREFADRFEIAALENVAAEAMRLLGKFDFVGSPIYVLLEESRARLRPAEDLYACRSFCDLPAEVRAILEPHTTLRTLERGETLVAEGAPSENIFVVRSGLLGVWLEKPAGGQWLVRCCFPGWLLGESSVLYNDNPRCTATLKAERIAEVWSIPAHVVREAMQRVPEFAERIASTKQLHRIGSFFSMHETMSQLDVQVRDDVLACLHRMETFSARTTLFAHDAIPHAACLVAKGSIELRAPGKQEATAVIGPDGFYGVRDSIHQICPGLEAVATEGSTIAFFDADRLRKLCLGSPDQVAATLERLG
jgi:CRP-like cAMP-binding protein